MNIKGIELGPGDSVKVIGPNGLGVFIWLMEDGTLSTSIGNGEVDHIQIESKETILSMKSPSGLMLGKLLS